jgi:hypothetical protein
MPLKLEIDSVDGLDDSVKKLYVQKEGGKYRLDLADEVPDVTGLKTALNSERTARSNAEKAAREAQTTLERFRDVDPDKYRDLLGREKDLTTQSKGWETMRDQLNETHKKELEAREGRITGLVGTLESQMITNVALAEIERAQGSTTLLLPHIRDRAKLVEENGKFHVRLFDEKGNPMIDNQGAYLTIQAFVTQLKASQDFSGAFKGAGASGGGSQNSGGGGPPPTNLDRATMTQREKDEYMDKHGVEAYMKLPMTLPSQRKKSA